ncbi:MAG: 30S ribosomal protein subunit S6 [Candidatus Hodgkinia cicadicola]|nr:MAG: 30S ribosomal protein subunit S6 [Candidatus Hodgkinia cicadicola]
MAYCDVWGPLPKAKVYELVMFFEPSVTKTEIEASLARLESLLTELGALAIKHTCWGKISLAYKIRGFDAAFGLHSSFSLVRRASVLSLRRAVCVRFKLLRFGLFASNSTSAEVKPSFCTTDTG